MPLNKNSAYVFKGKNHEIIILFGDTNDGTRYYLPSDMIVHKTDKEFTVQYPDLYPVGVPEGAKLTFTIDTSTFNAENAIIGKWLRDNATDRIGGELDNDSWKIPNCWIIKRNGIVEFIGVQQSAPKETHKPRSNVYEIQILALYKFAAEQVKFQFDTPPSSDQFELDRKVFDYVNIQNSASDSSYSYNWITGWGRSRVMPLYNYFIGTWWREFDKIVQAVTRSTEYVNPIHNEVYPKFYKPKNNSMPEVEVPLLALRLLTEIYVSESGDINKNDLKGGLTKILYDKYKNLWNYLIAETEGHAKRLRFSYGESGTTASYCINRDIQFICFSDTDIDVISLSDTVASKDGDTIEEAENTFNESNNRLILNRDKDTKKATQTVSGGSLAKSSFESTCVYGNSTSIAENFNGDGVLAKNILWTRIENSHSSIPCTQLLFSTDIPIEGGNRLLKVSDYCRIYYTDTEYIETDSSSYGSPFNPPGTQHLNLDIYNSNVNQLQSNGLAKLCNSINAEVLCRKQIWVELTIMNNKISANDLGKEYRFDFNKLFKLNYFYDEIVFGTRGVLVSLETSYVTGESKCKFFIRSDKWA